MANQTKSKGDPRSRGPTLSEISYTLAEITEIKLEIAKSASQREITSLCWNQKSTHIRQIFRKI